MNGLCLQVESPERIGMEIPVSYSEPGDEATIIELRNSKSIEGEEYDIYDVRNRTSTDSCYEIVLECLHDFWSDE